MLPVADTLLGNDQIGSHSSTFEALEPTRNEHHGAQVSVAWWAEKILQQIY